MEAVCIMFEYKPEKVKDPNDPMKKIDDYWGVAKSKVFLIQHVLCFYDKLHF